MNMPALYRCNKLFNEVLSVGNSGISDHILANRLGWSVSAVRSTASRLQNEGRVYKVKQKTGEWVIFIDQADVRRVAKEHFPELFSPENNHVQVLANKIAEAISEYVKATVSHRD